MPKVNLPEILSGYLSAEKINEAMQAIQAALDNTISRDGTAPNQLEADLDMNGYTILNTGGGDDAASIINRGDMEEYVNARASGLVVQRIETQSPGVGETVLTLATFSYTPGANNLAVYENGARLVPGTHYTETSGTTITLVTPSDGTELFTFVQSDFLGSVSFPTHTHSWSQVTSKPDTATRWPLWSEIDEVPATFIPTAHEHSTADITSGVGLADARRGIHVQSGTPTAGRTGELWFW